VTGRAVLIVGGSSGIGLATARELARRGDRVTIAARDHVALAQAERACRSAGAVAVRTVVMDVLSEDDVRRTVADVVATEGQIDVLVHTATVMGYGTIEELPAATFDRIVDTAVHGTANLARVVLPRFREQDGGTLVIVNSLLGSVTVPKMGAYATAKWGQLAIARTLQQETRDHPGIHVCIVSPGSTNTPIYYQAANYTGRAARPPIPVVQPERLATAIARLVDHPRQHVSVPVGPTNPLIISGFRLFPFAYDRLVGPLFKLAAQTRQAVEPSDGSVFKPQSVNERTHGHWPDK
jgi:NAD(P)-dependent dehydrogenase (short-subunit alcohol dehydrogenase family)